MARHSSQDQEAAAVMKNTAHRWIVRLASGEVTEEDKQTLQSWLKDPRHRNAFHQERALWRQMGPLRESLAASFPHHKPRVGFLSRGAWILKPATLGGGVAACLVVLALMLGNPFVWLRADRVTPVGQVDTVRLPDGSTAILNSDSAIDVHFTSGERRVELIRGEAWFSVKPDHNNPFRVAAGGQLAEAVGTQFNVSSRDGCVKVQVTEGVVAVDGNTGDRSHRVRLTAGLQFEAAGNDHAEVTGFDESQQLAWRHGRIVLEEVPLEDALKEVDRYRPGRILLLDRSNRRAHVSGRILIDDVDRGLEGLVSTQGLHVIHITRYLAIVR